MSPKLCWEDMEQRDRELILALETMNTKEVAEKFSLDAVDVRQWLFRIRERRQRFQEYLDWQNKAMERSERIRKLLSPSKAK